MDMKFIEEQAQGYLHARKVLQAEREREYLAGRYALTCYWEDRLLALATEYMDGYTPEEEAAIWRIVAKYDCTQLTKH